MDENKAAALSKINLREFRKQEFPKMPYKVKDYYALPQDTRQKMNKEPESYRSFWFDPEVSAYFDQVTTVKNKNWMKRKQLMDFKSEAIAKKLPTESIDALLTEYEPEDYLLPLELKKHEEAEIKRLSATDPIVKKIANEFNGALVGVNRRERY